MFGTATSSMPAGIRTSCGSDELTHRSSCRASMKDAPLDCQSLWTLLPIVDANHRVRGIAEEVENDLLVLDAIANDRWEVGGELRLNDHPVSLKLTQRQRYDLSGSPAGRPALHAHARPRRSGLRMAVRYGAGSCPASPARPSTVQQCKPVDHDSDRRRIRVSRSDGRQEALAV